MMKKFAGFLIGSGLVSLLSVTGQIVNPVSWEFSSRTISGNEAELLFTAKIKQGWHMYGLRIPDGGPIPTSFTFSPSSDYKIDGRILPVIKPVVKLDPNFNMQIELFDGRAEFIQKIRLLKAGKVTVSGYVEFMSCSDKECTPPAQQEFQFVLSTIGLQTDTKKGTQTVATDTVLGSNAVPGNDDIPEYKREKIEKLAGEIDVDLWLNARKLIKKDDFLKTDDNSKRKRLNKLFDHFYSSYVAAGLPDDEVKLRRDRFVDEALEHAKIILETKNKEESSVSRESENLSKANALQEQTSEPVSSGQSKSLWAFFLLSLLAGLGGILTPCVYPMIPMTVSFFIRNQENRRKAVFQAFVFGFSIMMVYTLVGVLVAIFKGGADAANLISTHWLSNSIFFVLFLLFAASFFGMFELILPSSLANRLDRQADKGGVAGAFFMALTTVIVSFSCTGPIVGSLLVEAASGLTLKPVLGMFGFGLAFSLPFTLFALFPSLLKNLPKSGGWLNAVKVVLGFIMLVFSLKFLSNISESYHLNFLSRELYLSIWIVLFILMGFYLLGKIKFAHDSEISHIGFPRFLLATASFVFAVYLIPGLFGAPLKAVGSLIPPVKQTSAIVVNAGEDGGKFSGSAICEVPLYADILGLPYGLQGYFDYEQGMECARTLNKPVFLDFKGHACSNCKKMEAEVWSDPAVLEKLRKNFVIIALYVDDRYQLPQEKWTTSKIDGKVKKTLGAKNADLQIEKFRSNTQPLYAIVDPDGNLLAGPVGAEFNVNRFITFLDTGIERYRQAAGLSVK